MDWRPEPSQYHLKVSVEDVGQAWRITISGDIHRSVGVEQLRQILHRMLRTGSRVRLEIELRGLRLINLAGIRSVDAAQGEAAVHRSHIDIVAGSPASDRVFALLDAVANTDPSDRRDADAG
jgi:hypothetical protein